MRVEAEAAGGRAERLKRTRKPRVQVPEVVEDAQVPAAKDVTKPVKRWWKKRGADLINDPTPLAVALVDVGKLALGHLAAQLTDPHVPRRTKTDIALAIGPRLGIEFRRRAPKPKTPDEEQEDGGAGETLLRIYGNGKP